MRLIAFAIRCSPVAFDRGKVSFFFVPLGPFWNREWPVLDEKGASTVGPALASRKNEGWEAQLSEANHQPTITAQRGLMTHPN